LFFIKRGKAELCFFASLAILAKAKMRPFKQSLNRVFQKADKEVLNMPSRDGVTTIQLEKKTRDRLMELGKKGDTYDDVINKLADYWQKRKK
jgi:hypothetical protein